MLEINKSKTCRSQTHHRLIILHGFFGSAIHEDATMSGNIQYQWQVVMADRMAVMMHKKN